MYLWTALLRTQLECTKLLPFEIFKQSTVMMCHCSMFALYNYSVKRWYILPLWRHADFITQSNLKSQ